MVTPKEIDDLIENTAKIIAMALSSALHPAMPEELLTICTNLQANKQADWSGICLFILHLLLFYCCAPGIFCSAN